MDKYTTYKPRTYGASTVILSPQGRTIPVISGYILSELNLLYLENEKLKRNNKKISYIASNMYQNTECDQIKNDCEHINEITKGLI